MMNTGGTWRRSVFWIFAVLALALVLAEHRAHALGWGLHALLGLCVVLLYFVVRADSHAGGAQQRMNRDSHGND